MAQEAQNAIDRDCLIAATLAVGGIEGHKTADYMVQRFGEILRAIRQAGGTAKMWPNAQNPSAEPPTIG